MAVTVSAVVLLLICLAVLIRSGSLRWGPMLVAVLFGFFLASTGIAPTVRQGLTSLANAVTHITF